MDETLTLFHQCKTLKSQSGSRQFPSPTRSTMGMLHQEGGPLVSQASQFSRPSMRPTARPYAGDAPSSSMRNPMGNMGISETPRTIQRPNVGMFDHFARPQIGALLVSLKGFFHTAFLRVVTRNRRTVTRSRPATGGIKNSDRAPKNAAAGVSASKFHL